MTLRKRTCVAVVMAAAVLPVFAETYYVATDGADGDGRGSADAPFATIAAAVEKAVPGDTVEVAAGTYPISAAIEVTKAITVRGATGNPNDVVVTRADGARCRIVIVTNGGIVDGMTLAEGYANDADGTHRSGGNVYMKDGIVRNCIIHHAYADSNDDHSVGVYMNGTAEGSCKLINCIVRNNINRQGATSGKYCGGGVFVRTHGTIEDCMISNNVSRSRSGAVGSYDSSAKAVIRRCVIYKNLAGYSGWGLTTGWEGGCAAGQYGVWEDCLVVENQASRGSKQNGPQSGVFSDSEIRNCTVLNNRIVDTKYGGVANTTAYNSIILGNKGNVAGSADSNYGSSNYRKLLTNCCSLPATSDDAINGGGNVWTEDSKLVTVTIPNTRPDGGWSACGGFTYAFAPSRAPGDQSPVVNKGAAALLLSSQTHDIAGHNRVIGTAPDMGCYETIGNGLIMIVR